MKKSVSPKGLTPESRRLWSGLQAEYQITDEGGLAILTTAIEAHQRMRAAQAQVEKDGLATTDRFGQTRAHPLLAVERDCRTQFYAGLRALNLDVEPLRDRPGRPGKGA